MLANPRKGSAFDAMVYSFYFRSALVTADIEDAEGYRPFHGLRRTSLTNAAAACVGVQALRTRAGHSSFSMTQEYISLADETFAEESALAAERLAAARRDALVGGVRLPLVVTVGSFFAVEPLIDLAQNAVEGLPF